MARNLAEIETVASRTLSLLRERIPVTQAYLFGSQVEGSPDESSDIDIAAVSPAADTMDAATKVALVVDVERQVDGFWLLLANEELFIAFKDFPWFKDASISEIVQVE